MSWNNFISILLPHRRREKLDKKSRLKSKKNVETCCKPSSEESFCDYGDFASYSTSCSCLNRGDDEECKSDIKCNNCWMNNKHQSATYDQLNYFQLLPQELIMHILFYVNMESLPGIFRTCKQFQVHSYNDLVWKEVCCAKWRERFSSYIPHGPIKPTTRSWKWMARTLRYVVPEEEETHCGLGNGVIIQGRLLRHIFGEWMCGKPHGLVLVVYVNQPTKLYFVGEYTHGQRNGYGKCVYKDGTTYEGEYRFGVKHGKGIVMKRDGTKYESLWSNGIRCRDYSKEGQ